MPCANAPLQYRKTGNGVVVYSVGPEGGLRGDYFNQLPPEEGPGVRMG